MKSNHMANISKAERMYGHNRFLYGIWNTSRKEFQFSIAEETPMLAEARLYQKIGDDAQKWRFKTRQIPKTNK